MPVIYANVPEIGTGDQSDVLRADVDRAAVDGVGGNRLASSGRWVVRVDGPQSALDALVARADVSELPEAAAMQLLNTRSSCTLTAESRFFRRGQDDEDNE